MNALAGVSGAKVLLFSRAGFSKDLAALTRSRADIELIDLERLYHGD